MTTFTASATMGASGTTYTQNLSLGDTLVLTINTNNTGAGWAIYTGPTNCTATPTTGSNGSSITIGTVSTGTYSVQLRSDYNFGFGHVYTYLTITGTASSAPSYTLSNMFGNEGTTTTVNVSTSNVPNGTTLYWTTDATSADINPVNGSFTINSNTGSFPVVLVADSLTEGTETKTIYLRTGSITGTVVQTGTFTIYDTSTTPPTYTASDVVLNETGSASCSVTTTDVPNSTVLYWTTSATAADVVSNSGSFTINSNQGAFTIYGIADGITEGTETYTIYIRTGSISGTIVGTSTLYILDDSPGAPTPSGYGLLVRDSTGSTMLDTTYRVGKLLGVISVSTNGSLADAGFAEGTPFYVVVPDTDGTSYTLNTAVVTFSGTTMTYTTTTACNIFYGVY